MKAIAILLIISMTLMSISSQALTKPAVKGKTSVKVTAKKPTPKVKISVKAKPSAKGSVKVGVKKPAVKGKVHIKIGGAVKKPVVKTGIKLGGKISLGGKTGVSGGAKTSGKTKIHIKIGKKSIAKVAPTCKSTNNMFGIKMITGPAKANASECSLKYSCCDAASYKTVTDKMNGFVKKLGSWVWSKSTLAKWVNFATTKLDFVKINKLCGNGKALPKGPEYLLAKHTGHTKKASTKPSSKKRILQALKVKSKIAAKPKIKISVKAKKPVVTKPKIKISVKAKKPVVTKPKIKISVKAKKPVVTKPKIKISVKAKKPVVKGKVGIKIGGAVKKPVVTKPKIRVSVKAKKTVVKGKINVHVKPVVKAKVNFRLGQKAKSVHSAKDWDVLVNDNKKCQGVFFGFMKLAKVCAKKQAAYGSAVTECNKGLYKLRKNIMCNSCNPSKANFFPKGKAEVSQKGWTALKLGSCLQVSMYENKCLRPQMRLINSALKTFNSKATDYTKQIDAWESMKAHPKAKAACLKEMDKTNFFKGFMSGSKSVKSGAKLHVKIGLPSIKVKAGTKSSVKTGAKAHVKIGVKKPVVKAKIAAKPKVSIKIGAKKPVVKAKIAAKPKVSIKIGAKKKERVLQALKVKSKIAAKPKIKISVKAKKPVVTKPKIKISVKAKKPVVTKPKIKVSIKAKKPVVKGKVGIKIGGAVKKTAVSGRLKAKVIVKAKNADKAKKYAGKWAQAEKALGAYKKTKFTPSNYTLKGNCLKAMKPFLWTGVKQPVVHMENNRLAYEVIDDAVKMWGSEVEVVSFWKKFYINVLKDSSSYEIATANTAKVVKTTVKGKVAAPKVAAPKVKVTVKAPATTPKPKVTFKAPSMPKAKISVKATAKKDLRRMQTSAAATTTGGMDVSTDTDPKLANQAPLVVQPAPGQETPFSASSNLFKSTMLIVTAIFVAIM